MRTCKIFKKPKKMKHYETFEWDDLLSVRSSENDLRFTLYEQEPGSKEYLNNALIIDIDHVHLLDVPDLPDHVRKVFGKYKMYWLHTGGGYHIYIPLDVPFLCKDRIHYKASYQKKARRLEHLIGHEVDVEVFNSQKYGRVPGSYNSRREKYVKFIEVTDDPLAQSIDDLLTYKKVIKVEKQKPRIVLDNPTEVTNRPLYKECGFIQMCHKSRGEQPHEIWKTAVCICVGANDYEMAKLISAPGTEDEIDPFFEGDYAPSCTGVSGIMGDMNDNPCLNCVHNVKNNSPCHISGPHPTPAATTSFHKLKKDESGGFVMNPDQIDVNDTFSRWVNDNHGKVCRIQEGIFRFAGDFWRKIVDNVKQADSIASQIKKEFYAIPHHGIRHLQDMENVLKTLRFTEKIPTEKYESFDRPEYIGLKNGVYDLNEMKVKDHHKEFRLIEHLNVSYEPQAKHPHWDEFLHKAIPDAHDRLLLQVFFGLTVSNIEAHYHQIYLWLYGAPLTGKSTVARVLTELIGQKRTVILPSDPRKIGNKEGFSSDLVGKSLLYCDDLKMGNNRHTVQAFESMANSLVGGAGVNVRKLYKDVITVIPKATFLITSNDPPTYDHEQSGTLRRARTIHFYNTFPKVSMEHEKKLMSELDGIFLWALKGYKYFQKNGLPGRSAEELATMGAVQDERDDSMAEYIKRNYEQKSGEQVNRDEVYNHYCKITGNHDKSKKWVTTRFMRSVCPIFGISKHSLYKKSNNNVYFNGITLIAEDNPHKKRRKTDERNRTETNERRSLRPLPKGRSKKARSKKENYGRRQGGNEEGITFKKVSF